MHTWQEYTYDIYLEKDIFVHTWVLHVSDWDLCDDLENLWSLIYKIHSQGIFPIGTLEWCI